MSGGAARQNHKHSIFQEVSGSDQSSDCETACRADWVTCLGSARTALTECRTGCADELAAKREACTADAESEACTTASRALSACLQPCRTALVVAPGRSLRPPDDVPRAERLHGVVTAVACARGLIEATQEQEPEPIRRIVHLADGAEVRCAGTPPPPCRCADIEVGDDLAVRGRITPGRPGVVEATQVTIGSSAGAI